MTPPPGRRGALSSTATSRRLNVLVVVYVVSDGVPTLTAAGC
jgi:hypothetical protein